MALRAKRMIVMMPFFILNEMVKFCGCLLPPQNFCDWLWWCHCHVSLWPLVGFPILGWLLRSSGSRTINILSPAAFCCIILALFSRLFDASMSLLHSLFTAFQSMMVAWWKIMSWLKARWLGEYLMTGLTVVLTAQATASRALWSSNSQSLPLKDIVLSISPMVKWMRLMTPLLLGFLTVVDTAFIP